VPRPVRLRLLLAVTFLGSVSSGVFWAGIFFITASSYHFSATRNLVLAAAMGAIYALAARLAGTLVRALERRLSPRAVLAGTLLAWGLAALAPVVWSGEASLWVAAIVGGAAAAVTWPIVESYLAAGRHGAAMRTAIGWFNVTWTPATAVPLLLMPLVAHIDPLATLVLSAAVNGVAALALIGLPARPAAHETEAAQAAVGREYPALFRAASWLLPLSYLLSATLAPVLPHRLAAVGLGAGNDTAIAALWMIARFTTLAIMWRVGSWHGRWGMLVLAAAALVGGTGLVLLAGGLPGVVIGLVAFGAGMGLTYYAALYYALAVGHAAVDAGGSFEALIGVGYCVGPLLGLGGHVLASGPRADLATIGLAAPVVLLACAAALRSYREARRARACETAGRCPRMPP
jgi:hypothetical protein